MTLKRREEIQAAINLLSLVSDSEWEEFRNGDVNPPGIKLTKKMLDEILFRRDMVRSRR